MKNFFLILLLIPIILIGCKKNTIGYIETGYTSIKNVAIGGTTMQETTTGNFITFTSIDYLLTTGKANTKTGWLAWMPNDSTEKPDETTTGMFNTIIVYDHCTNKSCCACYDIPGCNIKRGWLVGGEYDSAKKEQ